MTTYVALLDRPVLGWFVLDVMQMEKESLDWGALMIDVDPDSDDYRLASRPIPECIVLVPGKHTNKHAAWDALNEMMATRH